MKCVICKSTDIEIKKVEEEIKSGKDIVLIPINLLVCLNCGERYYDRKAIRKIEEIKEKLSRQTLKVQEVGKVLRVKVA
jgi:YgiT-type zinc finger domain-containing protein